MLDTPIMEGQPSIGYVSKDLPRISYADVIAAAAASDKTAAENDDNDNDLALPAKTKKRDHDIMSEVITSSNTAADPTAVTSNKNNQTPPLRNIPKEPLSDNHFHALSENDMFTMSAPNSLSSFFHPLPLSMSGHGYYYQGSNVFGGAAPMNMQMWGHNYNYHEEIMPMSMSGLSAPNMMMLGAGRQPQQIPMHNMMQYGKTKKQKLMPSDDGMTKNIKWRGKDANSRAETAKDVSEYPTTNPKQIGFPNQDKSHHQEAEALDAKIVSSYSKGGEVEAPQHKMLAFSNKGEKVEAPKHQTETFPNQGLFSRMLQAKTLGMKSLKNPPQAAEVEAEALDDQIAIAPSQKKDDALQHKMIAAPSLLSQWDPLLAGQKTGDEAMLHQNTEDILKIQNRFLEKELKKGMTMSAGNEFMFDYEDQESLKIQSRILQKEMELKHKQQQQQEQKYKQKTSRRRGQGISSEQLSALLIEPHLPMRNTNLSLLPPSMPMKMTDLHMAQRYSAPMSQNDSHRHELEELDIACAKNHERRRDDENQSSDEEEDRRKVVSYQQALLEDMRLREMNPWLD